MKQKGNNTKIIIIIVIIVILIILTVIIGFLLNNRKTNDATINPTLVDNKIIPKDDNNIIENNFESYENQKCTKKNCGAIDPVSDPVYNMKNVIKQTILLEEHLAEKNKYCIDCIIKHFLHCQGLLEEAIWLATGNTNKYPYLEEGDNLYKELFNNWLKNKEDKENIQNILQKLREFRKKLVKKYYIEDITTGTNTPFKK